MKVSELLVEAKLVKSRSEAKRLIKQGAVKIDGIKVLQDALLVFEK